ncbi:sirohydrochlorin chelatase [Bacillus sp. PK3-056]|uniref:sirohydrochlorin chelatase n=1 Tax=Niallia circulans TaxID=1397 RepID=UPI000F45E140|nr:sirohydrochlorin chelatase [Niallia circulans]AYV71542.1 sirohydrochlorin chelatase [Niallia circulans]
MDAVVYIGHGSRIIEGNKQFIAFIEAVKKEINIPVQEIAFLELTSPSIEETMEKVIRAGARDILVVPVLLFAAAHFKRDIPEELLAVKERFPDVRFSVSKPFDVHPKMMNLVRKRINEQGWDHDGGILLVGRGSSDPEPIGKLKEISEHIQQKLACSVYPAFLTAGKPEFEEELQKLQLAYNKIYIVPYLLFTGRLLKRMESTIESSDKEVILCQPLKYDQLMKEVLLERMEEQFMSLTI